MTVEYINPPTIRNDGFKVFLDFGVFITYEWERCFEKGSISEEQYTRCKTIQAKLDNQYF